MQLTEQILTNQALAGSPRTCRSISYWAHRASGVRGALLRALEKIEAGQAVDEFVLRRLVDKGFQILEQAAQERIK